MKKYLFAKIIRPGLYFLTGMLILLGVWTLVARGTKNEIPSPLATFKVFKEVMHDPMHNDPDSKGIGVKLLSSLGRVGIGFGLGSLLAIPLGLVMGGSKIMMK